MMFKPLNRKQLARQRALDLIHSVESAWGCTVTIHDQVGRLSRSADTIELAGRTVHTHPFCRWRRYDAPGWHAACNRHCLHAMQTGALAGPGEHTCWKGGREVVAPIVIDDAHLLTIFAGVFRGPRPDAGTSAWLERWEKLPDLSADDAARIADQLTMLGTTLLAIARPTASITDPRRQRIEAFLAARAHLPVGLADLADELGLSPGQCSREVRRLMGRPFRQLLIAERLQRAAILLRNYDLPIATIATRVGFTDP